MHLGAIFNAAAVASSLTTATSNCWASSSGVRARWGPLKDLRTDAHIFCNRFSNTNGGGSIVFGWQSAIFVGSFANTASCLATFNQLVSDCYGTNPLTPRAIGGSITDRGVHLVISFGNGAQL